MFKLILVLAMAVVAALCAPAPVPPLLPPYPAVYHPVSPYVKVIPYHSPVVPLAYHHGYKLIHPGSVYVY